jgi:rRNA-processing protein FCF1
MSEGARIYILDANILIDFARSDERPLKLFCDKFPVKIPDLVFNEVDDLCRSSCRKNGIEIIETEISILAEAGRRVNALSFQDNIVLLTSRAEQYICITNDKRLRTECEALGVKCIWGLEILLELVRKQVISKQIAKNYFEKLAKVNNRLNAKIRENFEKALSDI